MRWWHCLGPMWFLPFLGARSAMVARSAARWRSSQAAWSQEMGVYTGCPAWALPITRHSQPVSVRRMSGSEVI